MGNGNSGSLKKKLKESYRTKENQMRADFQRTLEAKEKKWGEMSAEIERLKKHFLGLLLMLLLHRRRRGV